MKTFKVTFSDRPAEFFSGANIARVMTDIAEDAIPFVIEIKLVRRVRKPKVNPVE